MPAAQPELLPKSHLELRINRAIKVFNRAISASDRSTFSIHHYQAVKEARDEIASLSAHYRDKHWGNLHDETTGIMAELTQDMESLMSDVIQPAFNRKDELAKNTQWPTAPRGQKLYCATRTLEFKGQHFRHRVECNNPAVGVAALDAWEKGVVAELVPAEARAA